MHAWVEYRKGAGGRGATENAGVERSILQNVMLGSAEKINRLG